jgi:hypothetical protein
MKKLLLLFITLSLFTFSSCSLNDDDRLQFHMEFVPVTAVEMPEYFERGGTYTIDVYYTRPNDCHYFEGFAYEANGNARTVAVQTIVIEDAECQPLPTDAPEKASFEFLCAPQYNNQTYVFKFYQGADANGNQQFLEVEVPVEQ